MCLTSSQLISFLGTFTPNDELAKEVAEASEITGEKFWRMPLEESYWESMKSGVADMVNTGGRQGGAITAALFLKQVHTIFSCCNFRFFCQFSSPITSYIDGRHLCIIFCSKLFDFIIIACSFIFLFLLFLLSTKHKKNNFFHACFSGWLD